MTTKKTYYQKVGKRKQRSEVADNTKKIVDAIEAWDFKSRGKITQTKVTELLDISLRTVKVYWGIVKEKVKELNTEHGKKKN